MGKRKINISFLAASLFFILFHSAYAQRPINTFIDSIADIEKKSFQNFTANGRMSAGARFAGTVASDNFDVNFYRCEWEVDPSIRFIKGEVTSYFTIIGSTDKIVYDLSDTLTVDSVTYHGNTIAFQKIGGDGLQIQFPSVLNAGQNDSVTIYYNGVPRTLTSFVQSTHSGVPIIWTLSEPFGAKEWWPCKNGLVDKADSIDIIITNPAAYQASANGVNTQESVINSNKLSVWKHRYPIASYLVAFAVTNYTILKDTLLIGGKSMDLIDYVFPENSTIFNSQRPVAKSALSLFGNLFGDYPFAKEKYGFTQFGANGGMEHQTNSFIISPSHDLLVHESGHQWFGDKITCASWKDIWLNEGFASYCQVLEFENSDKDYFYGTLKNLIAYINAAPDGSVIVDDTTNAGRIFSTRLSYYKGAYLLHMLRWELGDNVFFKGLKRYLSDPLLKYNFATTADLQRNLEAESGKNLSVFFQDWFYGQGYPLYTLEWAQDSGNNVFTKINQTTSHPSVSFFKMPVPVQFKNSTRDTIIVFDHLQNGQTFLANPGFKADTAIFDPYYWILCNHTVKQTVCDGTAGNDKLFPFYNIQWLQNANNWIFIDITQTNAAALSVANNIPLYLHFSGNGKDTVFIIKNTGVHYSGWINAGFKITGAFVTTSCFMSMNYKLVSLINIPAVNEINIFPVPVTTNTINISLKNPVDKYLAVSIVNAVGQLVYQTKFDTPGRDELFTLPVNNFAKGVYFIKFQSESVRITRRIVK